MEFKELLPYLSIIIANIFALIASWFSMENKISKCIEETKVLNLIKEHEEKIKNEYVTKQHHDDTVCRFNDGLNAIMGKIDDLKEVIFKQNDKQDERIDRILELSICNKTKKGE